MAGQGACDTLSLAEREVLSELLRNRSNAEIAALRGTSTRTVANQIASVFRKLSVGSRRELNAVVHESADVRAPPSILRPAVEFAGSGDGSTCSSARLTRREHQVHRLASAGWSNKLIAFELGVSSSTIRVLIARADAKQRAQAPKGPATARTVRRK